MNKFTSKAKLRLCLFVFSLFNSSFIFSQRLHLLHENTFEESTTGDAYLYGYVNNQHCCSYSVQRSNEITGIGSNVLRLEVRSTDALTSNSIRSEIVPDDESHPLDVDRWYGFKMYLKDWIEDDDSPESVWQWHPNSTTGSGSLSLWAHDGRFTVVTNPGGLGANTYDDIGPTLSDEWVDFVIQVKWSSGSGGHIKIWMNGDLVIDKTGANTTAGLGAYFKLGINRFGWVDEPAASLSVTTERVLYFDEVRIGDENAVYDDVAPPSTTPAATATLSGEIVLQGRPAPTNPKWRVPLRVDLYSNTNSTLLETYNVTTSANGRFIITDITPGTYHIAVKNSHTLKRINLSQTLAANNNVSNFGTLLEGDAINDNYADLLDFSILLSTYNKSFGEIGFNAVADFNEDNLVSAEDLSLLINNYNKQGEEITEGCSLVTATISNSSTCNGAPFNILLNSASGASPYDVIINGNLYEDITVSSTIMSYTPLPIKFWNNVLYPIPDSNGPDSGPPGGPDIELGVKFMSSEPGFITGIRFFTSDDFSGLYTGSLWSSSGDRLATGEIEMYTDFGDNIWQQISFSEPVAIDANTTYTVSYHTSTRYVSTPGGLTNGHTIGSNTFPAYFSLTIPPNGSVYKYGTSSFPNQSGNGANYWVDAIFVPGVYKFNLMSVTDNNGCNNTRTIQTLTVVSDECP